MELFLLYLWLKLNSIIGASIGLAIAACGATLFGLMWWSVERNRLMPHFKKAVAAIIALFAMAVLLPSKTDVAILVGGHYALKMADTPEAAKVMSVLRLKANELLDEQLKSKETK